MKPKLLIPLLLSISIFTCYCYKIDENNKWRDRGITPNELTSETSKTWYFVHIKDNVQIYNIDSARWYNDTITSRSFYLKPKQHTITFYSNGILKVSDSIAKLLHIDTPSTWSGSTFNGVILSAKLGSLNYADFGRYYFKLDNQTEELLFNWGYSLQYNSHLFEIEISQ